ncbi:MAG: hypothetical protein WC783_03265 [Candidatus Paceibacterota bacterium]|jgi:hypothetical protein
MKKYLIAILLGTLGVMSFATPVFAVTRVSFIPVRANVRQGQIFTLTIRVNPQEVKNYTAKTELRYPADLLEVRSFTFSNGWMPITQSGYDLTDNTNGVLIKTAGYPGGVSSTRTFGTVSFFAKKNGNGTIVLNNGNSLALDANNQNNIDSGMIQPEVVITVLPATETNPTTPTVAAEEPAETGSVLGEQTQTADGLTTVASQSLLASAGNALALDTNIDVYWPTILAILVFVGYIIYSIIQRRRSKNL